MANPDELKWKLSLLRYHGQKWLWRRLGRRLTCRTFLFLAAIKISVVVIYYLYKWNFVCSNIPIHNLMSNICDQYQRGDVVGDLCGIICSSNTSTFQVDSCQSWHGGKDVVFSARIDGTKKIYVKGRKTLPELGDPAYLQLEADGDGFVISPDMSSFEEMIIKFVKNNNGINLNDNSGHGDDDDNFDDAFDKLWNVPIQELSKNKDKRLITAMRYLWTLVQDNEYVMSKVHERFALFPKVYGTCGSLYAVEHLDPLTFPTVFRRISFKEWSIRVSVALAILEFLDELESIFPHPVHLCDVKASHFGIADDGKIKFLDLDVVYQKSVLDKLMVSNSECTSHADCHYFDCKGQCDLIRGTCINGVVNNNLQVICEKIFTSRKLSDHPDRLFTSGFLTSDHINARLERVLDRCANPTSSTDGTRLPAGPEIKMELDSALREVLDIAHKLERIEAADMKTH